MRESEVLKMIHEQRTDNHHFVKWWRKEEDFLDYDLIERFMENADVKTEIGGFDLLTMDEMWSELKRIGGTRIKLLRDTSGEKIEWIRKGKTGESTKVCEYTPETLMTIFDVETRGNPVD